MEILLLLILAVFALLILWRPYLGIVITAASLPIADVIPSVPFASSAVPLVGAITIGAFLMNRKYEKKDQRFKFINVHFLGLLFIGWIFISHPQAAWFGIDRNWLFTYVQLWVLIWLTGELLDSEEKHQVFMWVYSLVTAISAVIAIQQGEIGLDFDTSRRVSGLAEGANSAARYFVVAMLFLNYLRLATEKPLMRILAVVGLLVTFLGVFFTVSRTGILLIFVAAGMLILLSPRQKYQIQLIIILFFASVLLWFMADNVVNIINSIIPSIAQGTDTAGLRYALWEAGLRMWGDNLFTGVGIGMYPVELKNYGQDLMSPIYWRGAVAHNMYIQILAETGMIGLGIFIVLLINTLQNIWRGTSSNDLRQVALRNVWLIVFVIMLLGGITKSDQADKMIWLAIGVSVSLYNGQKSSDKQVHSTQSMRRPGSLARPTRIPNE